MNRLMKLLLSLVMAFNMIQFTPVFAEEDPTEPTEPQSEEVVEQEETVTEGVTEETPVAEVPVVNTTEVPETTEEEGPKLTYHDVDINVSKFAVKRTVPVNKGDMPESYDLRDYGWVSPVKDQNPYGTCWSFALMATAESNVLYQELESDPDLSELQMAYWMYNRTNDPLGLTKGDKTRVYDSFLDTGGNDYLATFAIAGGLGYVDEELAPYTLALKMGASVRLNSRLAYMSNSYRLTEAKWMYMADTDTVKEALMNGGAVAVSYYHDEAYLSVEKYIEEDTLVEHWCYNSGDEYEDSSNHAVTLVGWDDNYSADNFDNTPSADGAWLIKNSWGDTLWGEAGYFWISYEDLSLMSGLACQYTVVQPEEDENIYQYDGTASASVFYVTEEETTGANVYTATRNETIQSVGFFTDGDNTDYTVKACLLNEDWSTPEDAVRCTVTTGTATIAGYHEVEVEPVAVAENQQFSVIVTLNVEPDYENEEYAYMYVDESTDYEWIYFVNKTTPETSYLYNLFGEETWDDISSLGLEARIKAYTTPAPDYVDVTISTIMILNAGESGYLNPEFTPAIGNPDSIYWTSSDENIADVYGDGYVYAYEPGVAIVSVYKTSDDSLLASCEVTVEQPIESVETDCDYIVVPTGGSAQVSAWVTPADTTEDRVIFWDLRDEDVVSLNWECTSNGDVQTVNYVDDGKVTIYAKAVARPDICKAITVFSGTPYETRDLADVQYDLSAYKRSYNSVTLEWETQENVTGYYIYRATSATGKLTKIATVPMGSETYTDKSLTTGKTYYYAIRAYYTRQDGTTTTSAYSERAKIKVVPSAPNYIGAESKTKSVKVFWGKVSGASGYEVYRASTYDGEYKKVATVSSKYTYYTNKSLTANKVYFYKVRAYRTVSGKKIYSSFVEPTAGFANPSAPTDLKATVASTTSLKLSWKKTTGASMYSIYKDSGSGYELIGWYLDNGSDGYEVYDWTEPDSMSILGEEIDSGDENVYAFTDYHCEFGKEYKYKVKAFGNVYYDEELCGFTESSYSSSVTAKTAMKVVRSTRYYYTLSLMEVSPYFDEDAEEIGYQMQRKTSGGSYKTMYTGPSEYTMHGNPCVIDRTFKPGSTYYYRVRAYVVKDGKKTYTPWSASKKVSYKILDYEGSSKWPKKIYFEDGGYIRVTKASVKAYNVDKDAWLGDFKFTFTYDKRSTPNIRNTGSILLWTLFKGYLGEFTVGKLSSTGTITVWMRDLPLDVISYTFYDEYVGNYSGNPDDPQFDVPYELDPEMEPLPKE